MVKLYKQIDDKLFYAECWVSGNRAVTHWGVVGNSGKRKTEPCLDAEAHLYEAAFTEKQQKQGYLSWEEFQQYTVILRIKVRDVETGLHTKGDLVDALNNDLGWLGLGHVDGYDIDAGKRLLRSTYLRIFLVVIDSVKAKARIKATLDRLGLTRNLVSMHIEAL